MEKPAALRGRREKFARDVRIITAPPFMVAYLLIVLQCVTGSFFVKKAEALVAWTGLVIVPFMAYPLHRIVPAFHSGGRKGQRKLAFIFSSLGYLACFIYGITCGTEKTKVLFSVYFLTVVLLTLMNKLLGIRASGHAASSISPAVLSFLYANQFFGVLFTLLFSLSVWASILLKRHTGMDIIVGVFCFILALLMSFILHTVT